MPKITFIGAGSTVFAKNLLGDIFSFPELADSTISLFDIDPERLAVSERVAAPLADLDGRQAHDRGRQPTAARPSTAPTTPST